MKQTIEMIAAPPGMSPGGYVAVAYEDRDEPSTPLVDVTTMRVPKGWLVSLSWACPEPVNVISHDTNLFLDAAAVLTPLADNAPLYTMGAAGRGVEGALWRAESDKLIHIQAEGLGSVERSNAPKGWVVESKWQDGVWHADFLFLDWPALDKFKQFAIAIWRGADKGRGGLKSISPDWMSVRDG